MTMEVERKPELGSFPVVKFVVIVLTSLVLERRPQGAVSHEVRRRGQ